jgi:reactive intermediate/imine deaminase
MEILKNIKGLKANGHYGIAVRQGDTIYVSGQFSVDMETGERRFGTIEEETVQALSNIDEILKNFGSGKDNILKITIYIDDMDNWPKVDKVYGEFFGSHYPARTVACVKELHFGFKIEIDAIASAVGTP